MEETKFTPISESLPENFGYYKVKTDLGAEAEVPVVITDGQVYWMSRVPGRVTHWAEIKEQVN